MKRKINIKFSKNEKLLLWAIGFMAIFMLGVVCNIHVVTSNGGRMPFLYNYSYCDETHFSYQSPLSIRAWFLSDIFQSKWGIFSIGDVLMTIGFFSIVFLIWFHVRKYRQAKRRSSG